jgi:hypothetical protein
MLQTVDPASDMAIRRRAGEKHGYTGLDLGGINETTPGIARFKTRMGGEPFRLVGGHV